MGIKTVRHPPYSPYLAPYDFCLFPKLRDSRYETSEEIKEAVTKVIDTLTQENLYGAFKKLLKRYNKCIAAGGHSFERGLEFHVCTINKSAHTKESQGNYLMILVYLYIYIYIYTFKWLCLDLLILTWVSLYFLIYICISALVSMHM